MRGPAFRCCSVALRLIAILAAAPAAWAQGGSHEQCRQPGLHGGGFDPGTGLYGWTCASETTNWHGALDPSQQDASYLVSCTAPGDPHPTCLGSEDRMIGAVHQVGMAAARTKPGGTVWVPNFAGRDYAIWVDDGCGTLSDGVTRAKCPPAYTAMWRHLPHFDQSGPHVRGDRVQANRGVRIVAEGTPDAVETAGVWELSGGWLVADTGNAPSTAGPGPPTLDGPDGDLPLDNFRFVTGGSKWQRSCWNQNNTSLACDTKGQPGIENQWSGEDVWLYGVRSRIAASYSAGQPEICLDNLVSRSQFSSVGTCRGDRRYRCWDADGDGNTNEDRSDGSCIWTGVVPNVDLGPCDGFVDALAEDAPSDPDLRLAFQLAQCTQPATEPEHCTSAHGHTSYITEVEDVPDVSCASGAKTIRIVPGRTEPVPIPDFVPGSGPASVHVTRESLYDQDGGGFHGFGFMPGNYFGQIHASDVRFSGPTLSSGGTATLSFASPGWAVGQWNGFTAVIDPSGVTDGPLYQTIASNTADTLVLTMATDRTLCVGPCTEPGNAGTVTAGDVVEIRAGMCAGSFEAGDKGHSDESACDQGVLTGNFAGRSAGYYGSLHLFCSSPNGGPACADSNSLNLSTGRYWDGSIWRARRGFISDLSGDHMRNYTFAEGAGGTFLSNFSSHGINEQISFVDNRYTHLIQFGSQNITGARFRDITMTGNIGGGSSEIFIGTVQDLVIEDVVSSGGEKSSFMTIRPHRIGANVETSDLSAVVLRNLEVEGELGRRFGDHRPSAGIWIDVNGFGDDTESIDGLWVENAHFSGDGPNQCGIWLEDNHAPGVVLPLMEESRPSMTFRNVFAVGASGVSAAVCAGTTDGAPHDDASTSDPLWAEPYLPVLENAWSFRGAPRGGEMTFQVEGTTLAVTTTSGETAQDVAAAVAAAINGDETLGAAGFSASASGATVLLNGNVGDVVNTDPGLQHALGQAPWLVPVLGSFGLAFLALLTGGVATLRLRARLRC